MRVLALPAFSNKKLNPYNFLLYTNIVKQGHIVEEFSIFKLITSKYDVFHIHWPDSYLNNKNIIKSLLNFFAIISIITIAKLKGIRIFWTVHNIDSHNKRLPIIEAVMKSYLINNLSASIHLSHFAKDLAAEKYANLRDTPSFVIPHGHYLDTYPNNTTQLSAKKVLGISPQKKVVIMIGLMRNYKNCQIFIDMFNGEQDFVAILAGKAGDDETKQQFKRTDIKENIKIYDKFIDDDDIQIYLNASDLVIFPYRNVLNSGSVIMALGFNKQVLVPRFGSLIEIAEQFPDHVHLYDDEINLESVNQIINSQRDDTIIDMNNLGWENIAKLTIEAYTSAPKM